MCLTQSLFTISAETCQLTFFLHFVKKTQKYLKKHCNLSKYLKNWFHRLRFIIESNLLDSEGKVQITATSVSTFKKMIVKVNYTLL